MIHALYTSPIAIVGIISLVISKILTSLVIYRLIHPLFMIISIPLTVLSLIALAVFVLSTIENCIKIP
ncbi:hypothetical protein [Chlamydia poikilotherma]|nr:hypothetical protein [Chlamydia poikilotherma]